MGQPVRTRWNYDDGGMGAFLATPQGIRALLKEIAEASLLYQQAMLKKE
jgi:hypothetical protein